MKKFITLTLLVMIFTLTACQNKTEDQTIEAFSNQIPSQDTPSLDKLKPEFIEGDDFDEYGGADSAGYGGDNENSRYFVNIDFYRMTPDEQLTLIPSFKTMQQTTEWSCGPASALMTLWHFGKTDLTEMDIALAMSASVDEDVEGALPGSANNFFEFGTNVAEMVNFFSNLDGFEVVESSYLSDYTEDDILTEEDGVSPSDIGNLAPSFSSSALYAKENSDETELFVEDAKDSYFVSWLTNHLNAGRPIMVEWGDWDGHWVTIIGYDNNGTPSIGDDILIFADSYDTSDHWQDGYSIMPLERFFYMWKDRNIAPKPFQLQPYLVVDIKK